MFHMKPKIAQALDILKLKMPIMLLKFFCIKKCLLKTEIFVPEFFLKFVKCLIDYLSVWDIILGHTVNL